MPPAQKLWFSKNKPPSSNWVWIKSYKEARVFLDAIDWEIEVFSLGDLPYVKELITLIYTRQDDYQHYKPLVGVTFDHPGVLGIAGMINRRSMR